MKYKIFYFINKNISILINLGIGDWGLGFGGLGVWG